MATGLVCGDSCAGISWDFEVQQLTFSWGLTFNEVKFR